MLLAFAVLLANLVLQDARVDANVDDYFEQLAPGAPGALTYSEVYTDTSEYLWQDFALWSCLLLFVPGLMSVFRQSRRFVPTALCLAFVTVIVVQVASVGATALPGYLVATLFLIPGMWCTGRLDLQMIFDTAKLTPSVLPIAVIILLAPSLTSDVWQVASHTNDAHFVMFAGALLLPLFAINLADINRASMPLDDPPKPLTDRPRGNGLAARLGPLWDSPGPVGATQKPAALCGSSLPRSWLSLPMSMC